VALRNSPPTGGEAAGVLQAHALHLINASAPDGNI
jgi:hypothetical protein